MRAKPASRVVIESVTPRIDIQRRCRCEAAIVWDEVYGWLHTVAPVRICRIPHPTTPLGTTSRK
jgi:hypothetical protein